MAAAVVWYDDAATWEEFKAAAADLDVWEETYEEWLEHAEAGMAELDRRNIFARKVAYQLDGFLKWCEANDKSPDANARSQYASFVAEAGEYR